MTASPCILANQFCAKTSNASKNNCCWTKKESLVFDNQTQNFGAWPTTVVNGCLGLWGMSLVSDTKIGMEQKIIAPKGCSGLNRESFEKFCFLIQVIKLPSWFNMDSGFSIGKPFWKSPKASQTEIPKTKNRPPVLVWINTGNNLYPTCYNGVLEVEQGKGVKKVHSSVSWVCPPPQIEMKKETFPSHSLCVILPLSSPWGKEGRCSAPKTRGHTLTGQVSAACNLLRGFCCTTPLVRGFVFFGDNAGRGGVRPAMQIRSHRRKLESSTLPTG